MMSQAVLKGSAVKREAKSENEVFASCVLESSSTTGIGADEALNPACLFIVSPFPAI